VKGGFWLPGTVLVLGKKYSKTGEPCHGLLGVENMRRFLYIYKEAGKILIKHNDIVGDTLMAACSRLNNDWGRVGNGAKSRRKARECRLWYVCCSMYNSGNSLLVAQT